MTKLDSLQDIKDTAVKLQATLTGADKESIRAVEKAFQQLVDRFYQENKNLMAHQQYKASKKDYEYFLQLVDLAYCYFEDMEKKGTQSLH